MLVTFSGKKFTSHLVIRTEKMESLKTFTTKIYWNFPTSGQVKEPGEFEIYKFLIFFLIFLDFCSNFKLGKCWGTHCIDLCR